MAKGNGRPGETLVEFPDLGKNLRQMGRRLPWRVLLLVILVLAVLLTSVFTVQPEEVAVILRFGRFVRLAEPGLHFKLPLGIETIPANGKVPVERQLKEEFGFRTLDPAVRTRYSEEDLVAESLMLTGDLNMADVEWVVQYRIVDPYKYLFRVRNVRETFRGMSEAVMREVVGDRTVNEVLTVGRQEVATLVEQELQALCDQYETGLKVEQVVLQNVTPPDPVKDSFNDVNRAQQERARKINEAQSAYNQVVPRARGEAQQTIEQAEGYALDRVNRSEGDATRFVALFDEYRKAPEVTRKRLYLETLGQILPRAGRKIVVDDEVRGLVPLLNLEGAPVRRAPGEGD